MHSLRNEAEKLSPDQCGFSADIFTAYGQKENAETIGNSSDTCNMSGKFTTLSQARRPSHTLGTHYTSSKSVNCLEFMGVAAAQ